MIEPRRMLLSDALGRLDEAIRRLQDGVSRNFHGVTVEVGMSIDRDEAHLRCMDVRHLSRVVASNAQRVAEVIDYAWPAPEPRQEDSNGNETSP